MVPGNERERDVIVMLSGRRQQLREVDTSIAALEQRIVDHEPGGRRTCVPAALAKLGLQKNEERQLLVRRDFELELGLQRSSDVEHPWRGPDENRRLRARLSNAAERRTPIDGHDRFKSAATSCET